MNEFKDLYITDLNEEWTRPDPSDKKKMICYFELSGNAPIEWTRIFTTEYENILGLHRKWRIQDRYQAALKKIHDLSASGSSVTVKARERDVEKMKKLADKIIQRTNKKYREHLRQQEKDADRASKLRGRLFGKGKR